VTLPSVADARASSPAAARSRQEPPGGLGLEPLDQRVAAEAGAAEDGEEPGGARGRALGGERRNAGRRALQHGAVEEGAGRWHGEHAHDGRRSGGLSHHRDVAGVTAEARDVLTHPAKGGDHVLQARLAVAPPRHAEEPERAEPVVDADDHGVALPREDAAVVPVQGAGAAAVAAAVQPDDHGTARDVDGGRRDGQGQAVLALRRREIAHHGDQPRRSLRRDRTVTRGVEDLPPGPTRDRRSETSLPDGGLGERDPPEPDKAIMRHAPCLPERRARQRDVRSTHASTHSRRLHCLSDM